jgi:hypothetical protein
MVCTELIGALVSSLLDAHARACLMHSLAFWSSVDIIVHACARPAGWLFCALPWRGCMMLTSDHGVLEQHIFATAPWLDTVWPHRAATSHGPALNSEWAAASMRTALLGVV